MKDDAISRQAAKLKVARVIWEDGESFSDFHDKCVDCLDDVSSAQPEHRWIPVTKDTLPEEGKVVIVKGLKGTWDFGTYRGFGHINGEENIHRWQWKKNTYKSVYWWMYKDGALPEPYREEGDK